jgi:sortase (surface protein transpeptidase)
MDVWNKVDDGFGSGKSIDVLAKETGLSAVELRGLKKGNDDAKLTELVPNKEVRDRILESAFSTDKDQASQNIDSDEDDVSYVVYVRDIEQSSVPPFEKIIANVRGDYIFDKKDKMASEKAVSIVNHGTAAAEEVMKLKGGRRFKLSKKDVILREKVRSSAVEAIVREVPNLNAVMHALSFLRKGEAIQFKLDEKKDEYVVISIEDIEKNEASTSEFGETMDKFIAQGAAGDIVEIAMQAFREPLSVDVDHELIDKVKSLGHEAGE